MGLKDYIQKYKDWKSESYQREIDKIEKQKELMIKKAELADVAEKLYKKEKSITQSKTDIELIKNKLSKSKAMSRNAFWDSFPIQPPGKTIDESFMTGEKNNKRRR